MTAVPIDHSWATASPVRLTRRGRLAVLVLLLLAAFAAGTLLGARSAAVPLGPEPEPTRMVTVQPGQTLWDIASRAAPGTDLREVVEEIVRVNSLSSAGDLQIGQRLSVPTGS